MLIDVLVKKITVAENTKIEITFQFEDEMKMLYERLKRAAAHEGKDHCIIYSFICGRQRFG